VRVNRDDIITMIYFLKFSSRVFSEISLSAVCWQWFKGAPRLRAPTKIISSSSPCYWKPRLVVNHPPLRLPPPQIGAESAGAQGDPPPQTSLRLAQPSASECSIYSAQSQNDIFLFYLSARQCNGYHNTSKNKVAFSDKINRIAREKVCDSNFMKA